MWSIGVILYVLLAGFLPFDESSIVALFQKIQNADFTYPKWFSMEIRQVIDLMLVSDPSKRVTLKDLKAHAWLQEKLPNFAAGDDEVSAETVQAIAAEQSGLASANGGLGKVLKIHKMCHPLRLRQKRPHRRPLAPRVRRK